MNETRKKQVMTLSILAVAISAISIGFAAFSSNLNISSNLAVSPDESTFGVKFSSSATELATNPVVPTKNPETLIASNGTINNEEDPTITGLSVDFTEPGQKVEYTFYARNTGKYDAYLNTLIFENVVSATTNKVCTPGTGTNKDMVDAACNSISIKVTYNGVDYNSTQSTTLDLLAIGESRPVTVTIEYSSNGVRADGPFSIAFGDIRLVYSTVEDYEPPVEVAKICTIEQKDSTKYSVGDVVTCNIEETPDEFYVIAEAELTASTIQMLTKNNIHTTEYRQREAAGTIEFLNANNVVDNYVQYLNTKLPGATGELLTYDQAINLGCIDDNRACGPDANGGANAPTWVYLTNYWLKTDGWFVMTDGSFNYGPSDSADYGVRPVITISSDLIKK